MSGYLCNNSRVTQPEDQVAYIDASLTKTPALINYGVEKTILAIRNEYQDEEVRVPDALASVGRLGVVPDSARSLVSYTVPLMLMNQVEGGPRINREIVHTIGTLGVGSLCWVVGANYSREIAERYSIAPEEAPHSQAVNWRKEAGFNIGQCIELAEALDLNPHPGDVPFGPPEAPNSELIATMGKLLWLHGATRQMLASVMLSGHERSFGALQKAVAGLEKRLDQAVLNGELSKMNATTSRVAVGLSREIAKRVGVKSYMTYTMLKETIVMSQKVLSGIQGSPLILERARIEQREAFARGADPRTHRALQRRFTPEPEKVSIDIETPDGAKLTMTSGSLTDMLQHIKEHQSAPEPQAEQSETLSAELAGQQPKSAADMLPQAQELDFEILPEGGVDRHVHRMALMKRKQQQQAKGSRVKDVEVSDARMQGMKEIVDLWGADKVDFYTGNFSKRRKKKIEVPVEHGEAAQHEQPRRTAEVEVYDDFLIMVLKDYDEQGNLRGEHVIAESPFDTQEHGLFILRHDVRKGHGVNRDWSEIMKWHKDDVRAAGGRRLQHLSGAAISDVELMAEKVFTLLTCTPEEFERLTFDGYDAHRKRLRTHIRGGRNALADQIAPPEE